MSESERSEAISVLQDKLSWANQNRYPYVSQREVKVYQMIINFLKGDEMNQRSMLDKIRAEIEQITDTMGVSYNQYVSKIDVLQIIDKYKTEEGGEE